MLYLSLFGTLLARYGGLRRLHSHIVPFTLIFIVWIIIQYIAGLYSLHALKNDSSFFSKLSWSFLTNAIVALTFFYFATDIEIAPKTNFFIFLLFAGSLEYWWRTIFNNILNAAKPTTNLLLIGTSPIAHTIAEQLRLNPQIGYCVAFWIKDGLNDPEFNHLSQIIIKHEITTIVMPAHLKKSTYAARAIYNNLALGVEVIDLAELYERIFGKVPLSELQEVWFLENLAKRHSLYEALKRPAEFILALLLFIITLPLTFLIGVIIKLTSRGPLIYSQERVGKGGHSFRLYKFRSMNNDAEKHGPVWSRQGDNRVTPFGSFLRRTHLDEFPQLINVLRGELSIIGPRPERPEFVTMLREKIPFYDLRHMVKPGITGWAQVHYRYGASVNDAYEKLQYEIYYLKNRSVFYDVVVTLKTLRFFFSNL